MTWNYRVLRRVFPPSELLETEQVLYGVYEVYYDDGKPTGCTENPITVVGETLEEVKEQLTWMQRACTEPILDWDAFGKKGGDACITVH